MDGIQSYQLGIVAGRRLESDGDDAVAVMIVEEIGESLLPDPETGMVPAYRARCFRERKADLRQRGPGVDLRREA